MPNGLSAYFLDYCFHTQEFHKITTTVFKGFERPFLGGFIRTMKPRKKEDPNSIRSVAIYARVSTERQKVGMQIHELREYVERRRWTVYREYIDQGFSGSGMQRPAFSEMMAAARKRRFDVLLVWKLDRLSRSVKDLVDTLHELDALGIDFISCKRLTTLRGARTP